MNPILYMLKSFVISFLILLVTSDGSLAISTKDIIKLKKEGYTDQQIRQIIEKEKNKKDQNKSNRLDTLKTIEEAISYISYYGTKRGQIAIDKITLKVTEKEITQTVFKDTKHNIGPDGDFGYKERTRINIPFRSIKSIKVKTITVDEQNLPQYGLLTYFTNRTKRNLYYIVIKGNNLKTFNVYLKEHVRYDRAEAEIVKNCVEKLRNE